MLTGVLLLINPNLQKQKHFHTPSRSGLGRREKKGGNGYKMGPKGKEEARLCPRYAKAEMGRGRGNQMGFKTLLAQHCRLSAKWAAGGG